MPSQDDFKTRLEELEKKFKELSDLIATKYVPMLMDRAGDLVDKAKEKLDKKDDEVK